MYIYSKISATDLRKLSATNKVGNMYELIGIYSAYMEQFPDETADFEAYYLGKVGSTPYHYKGVGERRIKQELVWDDVFVSRKALRLLSRTYAGVPVITSSQMGTIFNKIVSVIVDVPEMNNILFKHILAGPSDSPLNVLYFQYDFLSRYMMYIISPVKKNLFRNVLLTWEHSAIMTTST